MQPISFCVRTLQSTIRTGTISLLIHTLIVALLKIGLLDAVRCYCTETSCEPYGYCESQWCVVGIRKSTGSVIRSCGTDQAYMLRICRRDLGDWQDLCACGEDLCNSYAYLRTQIRHNRFVVAGTRTAETPSYVQDETNKAAPPPPQLSGPRQSPASLPQQSQAQSSRAQRPQVVPPPAVNPEHLPPPLSNTGGISGASRGVPPKYYGPQDHGRASGATNHRGTGSGSSGVIPPERGGDGVYFNRVDQNQKGAGGLSTNSQRGGQNHRRFRKDQHDDGSHIFERNSLLVILLVVVPLGIGAISVLIVASNYYCHLC